jgi:uncharacterized protein (TIGR02594 family)
MQPQRVVEAPWFEIARMYEKMGVMEIPGVENHPMILSFYNYTTLKGSKLAQNEATPWCSAFACAVMEQAGIKSTRSAAARSWLKWGRELESPRPGCIVVFDSSDPTNKNAAHVAFLWGDRADDRVDVLGGNQRNKVCVAPYLRSDVIGYRWPDVGFP